MDKLRKKRNGIFYTPEIIFQEYIYKLLPNNLDDYLIADLFCGSGNLIIPILEKITDIKLRNRFFKNNINLYDIDKKAITVLKKRLEKLNIKSEDIDKNVICSDTLKKHPLMNYAKKVLHITNPPYLYKGHFVKNKYTSSLLDYFKNIPVALQDLYQLALYQDACNNIEELIYIIPSNLLFGDVSCNDIRNYLFSRYRIKNVFLFEEQVFQDTDYNIIIIHLIKKDKVIQETQEIEIIKSNGIKLNLQLTPLNNYRAGYEWDEFLANNALSEFPDFQFYLDINILKKSSGSNKITVLDWNSMEKINFSIDNNLYKKIANNHLTVRTLDTGSPNGRIKIFEHRKEYQVDSIITSKGLFRTSPIPLFFKKTLPYQDQVFIMKYFNYVLEYYRNLLDSCFLTTYRHSSKSYTRKIMGLNKIKDLIKTCPLFQIKRQHREIDSLLKLQLEKHLPSVFISQFNQQDLNKNLLY